MEIFCPMHRLNNQNLQSSFTFRSIGLPAHYTINIFFALATIAGTQILLPFSLNLAGKPSLVPPTKPAGSPWGSYIGGRDGLAPDDHVILVIAGKGPGIILTVPP